MLAEADLLHALKNGFYGIRLRRAQVVSRAVPLELVQAYECRNKLIAIVDGHVWVARYRRGIVAGCSEEWVVDFADTVDTVGQDVK